MKAIWTERSYGPDQYFHHRTGPVPIGPYYDKIRFESRSEDGNEFVIDYKGKQILPANLQDYDLDIEVKITMIPKEKDNQVVEFK